MFFHPLIKCATQSGLRTAYKYNRINFIKLSKRTQSTAHNQIETNNILENFHKEVAQAYTYTPSEGYVRNSPLEPVTIPDIPLEQYVWQNIHKWENHVASVCGITGRSYTYAKLRDHCSALAIRLQSKFKLSEGDVVAVCLPNIPEYPIVTLGALEAGLVVTTINPIYTEEEISRQLVSSDAKLIFGTPETYETIKKAVQTAKKDIKIICIKTEADEAIPEGAIDFNEIIETKNVDFSQLIRHNRRPNDLVFLPYSSGTTGLPKGVMLSHNNISVNCEMINVKLPDAPILLPTTKDFQEVSPCVLPFFHIYGFTVLLLSKLSLGTQIVTLPRFQPDTFLKSIADYKATMLHLVPPIILFLAEHESVTAKSLETARCIMCGAAPIGPLDVERLHKKAPQIVFLQGYGLTETAPLALLNFKGSKQVASVGCPPSLTDAKIVGFSDPTMKGLPANQQGELFIRGPQNMLGYLNNKEATDDMLVDGWLRTGDVAYYDEDGFFFITDRLKELIKVKGFQVAPAELEEILRDHPSVSDAAVVGIPNAAHGEIPRAFIVKKKDAEVTEKELQDFVAGKVAAYKQIKGGVQFLDAIPKNTTGKILRRELKSKYCS